MERRAKEDFSLETGRLPEPEGLFTPALQVMLAARAAGVVPLGFIGSIAEYSDEEKFRGMIRQARRLGFAGALCIHPLQVKVLNEEMTPSEAEVSEAGEIVAAYEQAKAEGRGSVEHRGKMLDEPIVQRASRLLAQYNQLKDRS